METSKHFQATLYRSIANGKMDRVKIGVTMKCRDGCNHPIAKTPL